MKSCKKSSNCFRNLVIILSVLCYTFVHSMSPPVLIVFEQLNYTKPDGIHAIFMPVIIEFSRYIRTYSSAKFEEIILKLASLIGAMGVIGGFLIAIYKFYQKPHETEKKLKKLQDTSRWNVRLLLRCCSGNGRILR